MASQLSTDTNTLAERRTNSAALPRRSQARRQVPIFVLSSVIEGGLPETRKEEEIFNSQGGWGEAREVKRKGWEKNKIWGVKREALKE